MTSINNMITNTIAIATAIAIISINQGPNYLKMSTFRGQQAANWAGKSQFEIYCSKIQLFYFHADSTAAAVDIISIRDSEILSWWPY